MNRIPLAALVCALAVSARAEITVVRHFRLGEADTGAVPGSAAAAVSIDSAANDNLTLSGSPLYSADVASANSTISMEFNGTTHYATTGNWDNLTSNFGVEAWVKPAAAGGEHFIIYNGQSGANGWGMLQNPSTGKFGALFGGRAFFGSGDVVPGVWTHLAIVCTGTLATFYVDGVASGSTTNLPLSATGFIGIGSNAVAPAAHLFEGKIDEVRVFTFAQGAFVAGDLLLNAVLPPLLNFTRVNTTDTLTWPTTDRGFGVETSTDLLSNDWTPVYQPGELNGAFYLTRTSTDPARFYRLKKPCGEPFKPRLLNGSFITQKNGNSTPRAIMELGNAAQNTIGNGLATIFDASNIIDPASCNGGTLLYHWVITYPNRAGTYTVAGITGYQSPVLTITRNSLLNDHGGTTFTVTVTSLKSGLIETFPITSVITGSSLTVTQFNECQQFTECPCAGCGTPKALRPPLGTD